MAFKLTTCKETALKAFLIEWLKDDQMYCNYCGSIYYPAPIGCVEEPCCDKPQIGTNKQILEAFIVDNLRIRKSRLNEWASNKEKTLRLALAMPPRLLHDWEQYSASTLKEPLFRDDGSDLNAFLRTFPEFMVPEQI